MGLASLQKTMKFIKVKYLFIEFLGFFSMNKKHGLGIKIIKNKNVTLIGNWINDTIDGLVIYISEDKVNEEKFLYFEKNKSKLEIIDKEEIDKIKESILYEQFKEFYSNIKD